VRPSCSPYRYSGRRVYYGRRVSLVQHDPEGSHYKNVEAKQFGAWNFFAEIAALRSQ